MAEDVTRLLTYAELSEALGITAASAKRLAIRRKWRKTIGNDGLSRVHVPVDHLTQHASDASDDTEGSSDVSGEDAGGVAGDARVLIFHLEQRVTELRAEVAELRPKAVEADVFRGQLDGLKGILEAEKRRADELRLDRDRLVERLSAPMPISPPPLSVGLMARLRQLIG